MAKKIDQQKAKEKLKEAFENRDDIKISDEKQKQIDDCLDINKTYAYILVNGLLAKSVNGQVDATCLQAGAKSRGAYDARSLCHSVIVQNNEVNSLLGNSNEPFLNKPARIASLKNQKAFKGGKNGQAAKQVKNMTEFLSSLSGSDDSFDYLKYALKSLENRRKEKQKKVDEKLSKIKNRESKSQKNDINDFYKTFLENSCNGESLTLCIGAALKFFYLGDKNTSVKVHNSNESGACGREIEDIDVYSGKNPFCCFELKDKKYETSDICTAVKKALNNKVETLLFVEGPNASFNGTEKDLSRTSKTISDKGINFSIAKANDLFSELISLTPNLKLIDFLNKVIDIAKEIKAKDKTTKYLEKCLEIASEKKD